MCACVYIYIYTHSLKPMGRRDENQWPMKIQEIYHQPMDVKNKNEQIVDHGVYTILAD